MKNKLVERYKVQKSPIEISYEIQLGLIKNEEYDKLTDDLCISLYNYFIQSYPGVEIEIPKKRIKSPKSTHEKCKSREIERLSKLYIMEGLTDTESEELYNLLAERIKEREQDNINIVLQQVKDLLQKDVKDIDIDKFLKIIMVEEISSSTKKALLRILNSKIENSNIKSKQEKLDMLDYKYGKKAAEISGIPEDDIMQYTSIEEIKKDKARKKLLRNEIEYLKSEDLIATKIVITEMPTPSNVKSKKIKELLALEQNASPEEKMRYKDMAMKRLAGEFIEKICKDKKYLRDNKIEVIPFSVKHKNKTNGYNAYHIKFRYVDKPEYTMELQVKSQYVENLSRGLRGSIT